MNISVTTEGARAVIRLCGRFDFSTHSEFGKCYSKVIADPGVADIDVDLGAVDYLDSAALGMLLLLSERAKIVNKAVALANPNEMVAQILERVSFGRIFAIR